MRLSITWHECVALSLTVALRRSRRLRIASGEPCHEGRPWRGSVMNPAKDSGTWSWSSDMRISELGQLDNVEEQPLASSPQPPHPPHERHLYARGGTTHRRHKLTPHPLLSTLYHRRIGVGTIVRTTELPSKLWRILFRSAFCFFSRHSHFGGAMGCLER